MTTIFPRLRPLPNFNAVAAGATATLDLPTDGVYYAVDLLYSRGATAATEAQMISDLLEVRVNINGVTQRKLSAGQIIALNKFRGQPINSGVLTLYFALPWRPNAAEEDALAWGMADVSTFQIEVDIEGTVTTPVLKAQAYKLPVSANMGPIIKQRRFVVPVGATGLINFTTLPRDDSYLALHAVSANISDIEVIVDGEQMIKSSIANLHAGQEVYGLVPQSGYTHLAFDRRNRNSDLLTMTRQRNGQNVRVSDFQLDFMMTSATSFTLITEQVGTRD
ncbi:major capsid protein P2 [Hoeflea sp.]|uniref:major capsid protein P2 n=1 Tax=Hoeflea sp. TaxID=1940281 RepID=UPI0019C4187D|nr:major capsid protein P2 [Hoeflea sp.]MBC7286222.1 hypothetical protein [Hoeflea sp.]